MQNTDKTTATRLIKAILQRGYTITVDDGEEETLLNSSNFTDIMDALGTTDADTVYVDDTFNRQVAVFFLVYGNDKDELINDLSDNPIANEIYEETK